MNRDRRCARIELIDELIVRANQAENDAGEKFITKSCCGIAPVLQHLDGFVLDVFRVLKFDVKHSFFIALIVSHVCGFPRWSAEMVASV